MKEENIHLLFVISLAFKALFAVSEIIAGLAAYLATLFGGVFLHFLSPQFLVNLVETIAHKELIEDPRDIVANFFLHMVQGFSTGSLHFASLYLLSHGVIKFWLIIGLLRKRLWYYPTAMVVFGLFMIYQLYRYSFTHSVLLLFLTVVDLIVIVLTWHEYQYLSRHIA